MTDVGLRVVDSLTVLREDGHGVDDVVAAVGEEAEVVLCTIDQRSEAVKLLRPLPRPGSSGMYVVSVRASSISL